VVCSSMSRMAMLVRIWMIGLMKRMTMTDVEKEVGLVIVVVRVVKVLMCLLFCDQKAFDCDYLCWS
jgi:hypothetical protein